MSGEEDTLTKATKAIDDLYNLRDTYFPANPQEKASLLQNQSDLALDLLDSIPQGLSLSHFHFEIIRVWPSDRARCYVFLFLFLFFYCF